VLATFRPEKSRDPRELNPRRLHWQSSALPVEPQSQHTRVIPTPPSIPVNENGTHEETSFQLPQTKTGSLRFEPAPFFQLITNLEIFRCIFGVRNEAALLLKISFGVKKVVV
jgi:hypothetical protein